MYLHLWIPTKRSNYIIHGLIIPRGTITKPQYHVGKPYLTRGGPGQRNTGEDARASSCDSAHRRHDLVNRKLPELYGAPGFCTDSVRSLRTYVQPRPRAAVPRIIYVHVIGLVCACNRTSTGAGEAYLAKLLGSSSHYTVHIQITKICDHSHECQLSSVYA